MERGKTREKETMQERREQEVELERGERRAESGRVRDTGGNQSE